MTGVAGTPWYSNTYHTLVGGSGQGVVDAVRDFWTNLAPSIDNAITVTVEGDTALVDDVSGAITGIDSVVARTLAGSSVANALPPATQGILHTFTGTFVGGRQLRGKIFIPGLVVTVADSIGAPTAALKTALLTQGALLVANTSGPGPLRVWSRTNGISAVVNSVTTPSKFGVLRSRRD